MTDPDPLERLRHELEAHFRTTSAPSAPTPGCLDDAGVAALAQGTLERAARAAAVSHLAACSRCRGAVASVVRALADPAVAGAVAAADAEGRRRLLRFALPAAAAAALLLVASWPRLTDGPGAHRERAITAAAAPSLDSPVGTVASAAALRWSAVAGADRYRVTLFDTQSHVVYETELADTLAVLPDSVVLVPGQLYMWKVVARTGWDRWVASELAEFRIARGSRP